MVVERAAPRASPRRSDAQNQPFQSHRPEQIEVFQPFHHVRPLVYQHIVEFDFADGGTTNPFSSIPSKRLSKIVSKNVSETRLRTSPNPGTYSRLNYSAFLLLVLWAPGWSLQTCNVNSLSRCSSKFRIISSKDLPAGAPEGLKTQAHSEQPQPRKRARSIHTSARLIAALVAAPRRCLPPCLVLASRLVCGTKRVVPNA